MNKPWCRVKVAGAVVLVSLVLAGCAPTPVAPRAEVVTPPPTPTAAARRAAILGRLQAINYRRVSISEEKMNFGQGYVVGETVHLVLNTDYFFPVGSTTLLPRAYQTLKLLADLMNTYKTVGIDIVAYTDTASAKAVAVALTQAQANVLLNQFWSVHGMKTGIMTANGMGSADPVAPNATFDGRRKNRRIVITFKSIPSPERYN